MGCGISRFGRNQGGNLSFGSEGKPIEPQVDSVDDVKEKENKPSPSHSLAPEREELERIKVKEEADDNSKNNHGHEETNDSIFNYPRSPSFREYCTDPEIRFGIDSTSDSDGDDIDTKKISKSIMSSPNPQDKLALQSGSKGESATEANSESKGRSSVSLSGQKIRNTFGYYRSGRGGSAQGSTQSQPQSRIRSYFQLSNWRRLGIFTRSSAEKAE